MPNPLIQFLTVLQKKRLNQKQFVLFLSIVIGFASGLTAIIIKNAVHFIESLKGEQAMEDGSSLWRIVFPAIGLILTTLFVKKIVREPVKEGIPNTLFAISKRKGNIRRHNLYSSIVGSALTVGFGGSVGLEGPAVATSSAIGSVIGQSFKLNRQTKALLIGCASAGALSAIFNAPIAAIVFAIEVIMLDLTATSLIPLLLASITATLTSRVFFGNEALFHFNIVNELHYSEVLFYILLGIFTGLVSVYFRKTFFFITRSLKKITSIPKRIFLGASVLGLLVFLFPAFYGEGYGFINSVINGSVDTYIQKTTPTIFDISSEYMLVAFLISTVLLKVVATSITLGSGGIGGIFAPTLFMGSTFGFLFARLVNTLGFKDLPESNFTLVGMAGMMAGVLHAPLTAIFLIAEITGGYTLFVPLMLTAVISYITVRLFSKHSVYTEELAARGELITHDKDQAILTLMTLEDLIEKDFETISPYETLGDLIPKIAKSSRNHFPVLNKEALLIGIVSLNEIRPILFNTEEYSTEVHTLMDVPEEIIDSSDSMNTVLKKFEASGAWNLPVVEDSKYVGFVSRSKLFDTYRQQLVDITE